MKNAQPPVPGASPSVAPELRAPGPILVDCDKADGRDAHTRCLAAPDQAKTAKYMFITRFITLGILSVGSANAEPSAKAPRDKTPIAIPWDPPANPWKISGGVQYRQIGSLNWHTGSRAATAKLPWLAGPGARGGSSLRLADGIGEHAYDDGFVNPDEGTPNDGLTSYYSFLSDSQLQGDGLVYHSNSGGGSSSSRSFDTSNVLSHPQWTDDLAGMGFFAKIDSPSFYKTDSVEISATFGYSFAGNDSKHHSSNVFSSLQTTSNRTQAIMVTDRYDTTGLIMPSAPFIGTKGGDGYPLIGNAPSSRMLGAGHVDTSETSALLTSDVQESFDIKLHTISLGPNFSGQFGRLSAGMALGLGVTIANWDASHEETVRSEAMVIARFHDRSSGTEILPGFYLEANVGVNISDRIQLFASGRYDWMAGLNERVGPSQFELNLGGWTAAAGLRFSF